MGSSTSTTFVQVLQLALSSSSTTRGAAKFFLGNFGPESSVNWRTLAGVARAIRGRARCLRRQRKTRVQHNECQACNLILAAYRSGMRKRAGYPAKSRRPAHSLPLPKDLETSCLHALLRAQRRRHRALVP